MAEFVKCSYCGNIKKVYPKYHKGFRCCSIHQFIETHIIKNNFNDEKAF